MAQYHFKTTENASDRRSAQTAGRGNRNTEYTYRSTSGTMRGSRSTGSSYRTAGNEITTAAGTQGFPRSRTTTYGRTAETGRNVKASGELKVISGRSTTREANSYRGESTGRYTRQLQDPAGMTRIHLVEGSTARQLAEPKRRERHFDDRETAQRKAKNVARMPMNLPMAALMAALLVVVVLTGVYYLQLKSDVTVQSKNVVALEKEYEALVDANDQKEMEIAPLSDYAHIYQVATEELGMQTPTSDQVRTFTSEDSEYVIQYESIPESDE